MKPSRMLIIAALTLFLVGSIGRVGPAAAPKVTFSQSAPAVDTWDFVEITMQVDGPTAANPFTDVVVRGEFRREGDAAVAVDGFCDAQAGRTFRIRFMPTQPGKYSYSVKFQQGDFEQTHTGAFEARPGNRRGIVRVDKDHPYHFRRAGADEHFFWNGTTTYWLMGWDDENIRRAIDRLAGLKVNYLRVVIDGRVKDGRAWYENVFPTDKFTFLLNPWVAARPDSVEDPGFDVKRFNVAHWRKYDRLLRHAREKDVIISVIFYVDGRRPGVDPFGKGTRSDDEKRYYQYAAARFAPFSNVMWDLTNEYRLFRDDEWCNWIGPILREFDPYDHLISVHGHGDFRFRKEPWADFAMYQNWDEHGGYKFMLKNRQEQEATGRPMPQVNEEYGYEDHYPQGWGGNRKAPARSADNRRRLAWEMYMAGGYQTTGERADRGTGWGPDTGGGWLNGRGDDTMVMLKGYGHIVDFFKAFEWWKTNPDNSHVNNQALCLAEPGRQYIVYLPKGGNVTVKLEPGTYEAKWYNARTGEWSLIGEAKGPEWTSPNAADEDDWAILLKRKS